MAASWTQLSPATSPGARRDSAMGLDRITDDIILFGGFDAGGSTLYSDTWKWDGSTWTELFPASVPTVTAGYRIWGLFIDWDDINDSLMLCVTEALIAAPHTVHYRFFAFDPGTPTWTEYVGAMITRSSVQTYANLTRFPDIGTIVFNGSGDAVTYQWNGATFAVVGTTLSQYPIADSAAPTVINTISNGGFAYDDGRHVVTYYGGNAASVPAWQTTADYNGTSYSVLLPKPGAPGNRGIFDSNRYIEYLGCLGCLVIYSGRNDTTTWALKDIGAGIEWTNTLVTGNPNATLETTMCRDANGHIILFGGQLGSGLFPVVNETWRLACETTVQVMRWW